MSLTDGPRAHGGPSLLELEELGISVEEVLDFSVSTNPYGPSPAMAEAIRRAPLSTYPDPAATAARRRLGEHLGVSPERLALGNGAADLLWALARTLAPGARVLLVEPTFSEFRSAARAAGGELLEWRARPEDDLRVDLAAVADRARAAQVVYLCAPGVPAGTAVPAQAIAELAAALPAVTFVIDQSFLLLSERFADLNVAFPDNVAAVRSLTKEHGIPGVRVGYLLAAPALLRRVDEQRPAWSASAAAQAAALASCTESGFVAASRERLLADRRDFVAALAKRGFTTVPTSTNFFLVKIIGNAPEMRRRLLLEHRLLVRDCSSFGLPSYVRISTRTARECTQLVEALHAVVASGAAR